MENTAEQVKLLQAEITRLEKRNAAIEAGYRKSLESQARTALQAAGGADALLLPHIMNAVGFFEVNGVIEAGIKDREKADSRRIKDVKGTSLSIEDLIAEMKTDPVFSTCFDEPAGRGDQRTGNGRRNAAGAYLTSTLNEQPSGAVIKRAAFNKLSPAAQMEHMTSGGTLVD